MSRLEERIASLESVSPADIQTLARRLFAGKHVAVVKMYWPERFVGS